ncbi:MAG: iron ABC transporter permease, partial [Ideonella sp.]
SGSLQVSIRQLTGASGALWPDVRSLWGAALMFSLCLYPYVYLLARAALGERGVHLMEAARMLGAGTLRRVREVALPLARPAIAAGVALALMETLADYGVTSYFGLQTFTTGIYKAWLVMNDADAAAELASLLLLIVAGLMWLERRSQSRLSFASSKRSGQHGEDAQALRLRGWAALVAMTCCALPVLLGFVLPVLVLLGLIWQEARASESGLLGGLPWARFGPWAWTSFKLAGIAAVLATLLSLVLAFNLRLQGAGGQPDQSSRPRRERLGRSALLIGSRIVSLGYAVPGAVIAVGILLPVGWLQREWPEAGTTALVTGSLFGVMYAYLVRFSSVALQSVDAGYARLSRHVDETARMLGSSRRRIFTRLHAPLLQRAAFSAMLLVFVDVMKELPATLVLRPFNSDTLAVVAYQLARDERLAEAALPSLAIVLVGLAPVLLLSRSLRSKPG